MKHLWVQKLGNQNVNYLYKYDVFERKRVYFNLNAFLYLKLEAEPGTL